MPQLMGRDPLRRRRRFLMRKPINKLIPVLSVILAVAVLLTVFSACGKNAESDPTGSASSTESAAPAPTATPTPSVSPTTTTEPSASPDTVGKKDGERFESVITIEGMEETVHYEHIRNESIGFEIDYDYENFQRRSEADRECFVSVWDDAASPENYLEIRRLSQDAETAAASIAGELSERYEVGWGTYTLERAGDCIRLDASVDANDTSQMMDQLQTVYIIPASDGCYVATEHYAIEASEGFGRRFSYMMHTFSPVAK